jgi:integrase
MARKPLYGCNKGLARTTVHGKRIYLGEYNSPESKAAFEKIIADWEAAHAERSKSAPVALTVNRLAVLFLKHAEKEYVRDGKPTGEAKNFRYALKSLTQQFHGVRVVDFGPKKLKQLQQTLVARGLAQATINGWIRRIKQVFDWGVSEEIVPGRIAQDLHTVAGLRQGRTSAPSPKPKGSVAAGDIEAVKPFVTTPVWGMIQFMLLTGCRPSECCRMKWSEIDTSQTVWTYCPHHHKTAHKGKKRLILIGPKGQRVLNSLREMSRSDFVFDPKTGVEEFLRSAYGENAMVRSNVGECYSEHSLHAAVRKACERAIEKGKLTSSWSPGQLRKTRATSARQQGDLETAQQVLGHSSKQTTERHYAEVDVARAAANALEFG